MYAIILSYKKPMEDVEKHTAAHRSFLDKYYEKGVLLISGRQNPPNGGVIIAKGEKATLEEIFKEDPFYQEGIADYQYIEFVPTKYQPVLNPFVEGSGL